MNSFRENLREELEPFELNADINSIVKKENRRRKKLAAAAVSCFALLVAVSAAAIIAQPFKTDKNSAQTAVQTSTLPVKSAKAHSFRIVSSAAPDNSGKKENSVSRAGAYMIQCCFKCNYYVNGVVYDTDDEALDEIFAQHNVEVHKSFELLGDNSFCVEGEDIARVKCTAENGEFMLGDSSENAKSAQHTVELEGGSVNGSLSYIFPSELNDWMVEENENNLPIDYSKAPTDNITVAVTFTDGTEQSVKVKLYFNDYGYLVVETEDGTKYNDGSKNDYEKWKNGSGYDENGDLVIWDYSGRTDEKTPLN